jgi:hypothetical protein
MASGVKGMGRGDDPGHHGGPDQFLPQRMEAWPPPVILLLAQFESGKCYDTSVCRYCVISFAHSKVHTGHK